MIGGPSAYADTLLYEKGDTIWLANPNGTQARAITPAGAAYGWPSESDAGTVVAQGPGTSTLGKPVLFGNLYVMDASGKVSHQITTPADVETCSSLPALNVRISPDAQRIAYYEHTCATDATWWTPTNSTNINYPGQILGQQQLDDPAWMDNSHLLLSDVAEPFLPGQQEFNVYTVGGGDDSYTPWFSDTDGGIMSSGWAYGFNASISRQGTKIAVVETDGNLTPQRVELHLFTTTGSVPAAPTFNCAITLAPASDFGTYILSSPSFSPDGSQLAFAETDGVHVANVGNLSNCASVTAPLVIPGGAEPFWSPAALPKVQPPPPPPPPAPVPALSKLHVHVVTPHKGHTSATASYTDSVPAKTTLTLDVLLSGIKHGSRCAAPKGKPKHGAKHCTLHVKKASFTHTDVAGPNTVTFPTAARHALKPGHRYQLVLVGRLAGKTSKTATASFKVG